MDKKACFSMLALLVACKGIAATSPQAMQLAQGGEAEFFTELPVVMSVTRLEQPTREAPASVTVITADDIRSSGARELADVLRLVPGFVVAESIYGAPMAVYHGLNLGQAGRMHVLVDGRSQYSPLWFGGNNWNVMQVSLPDIERIEVVRGSNSAAYGANAMLGVVNIKTYSAHSAGAGKVELAKGGNGTQDLYASKAWDLGEHAFQFSAENRKTDGLDAFPDSRDTTRLNARLELRLSPYDELLISGGGVRVKQGIGYYPESGVWLGDEPSHDRHINSYFGQFEWHRRSGDGSEFTARYFRITETGRESYRGVFDLDGNLIGDAAAEYAYDPKVARDDIELSYAALLGSTVKAVVGIGGRRDEITDRQLYYGADRQTVNLLRVFGHGEWRALPQVLLSLGGTYENDSLSGETFAPRLAANWFAAKGHTLRTSYSRAYRSPSLFEQRGDVRVTDVTGTLGALTGSNVYQETLAIHPLKPEQVDSYDIGYLGEFAETNVTLDVRGFYERIEDVVVNYGGFPVFPADKININGLAAKIRGVEAQARWNPIRGTRFWVNQTALKIDAEMEETPTGYSQSGWEGWADYAEESAPRNQTSIHWWQEWLGTLNSTVSWYRVRTHKWTKNTSVPPYHRLDWRLAMPFRQPLGKGELAFTMRSSSYEHAEYRYSQTSSYRYNKQVLSPVGILSLSLEF